MNQEYLLDASALLALIFDEPGAGRIRDFFDECRIHSVNLAEAMRKMVYLGMPADEVISRIAELHLELITELPWEEAAAIAGLGTEAKRLGLSLGDCLCLAVARKRGAVAVTADRRWSEIQGGDPRIRQIR